MEWRENKSNIQKNTSTNHKFLVLELKISEFNPCFSVELLVEIFICIYHRIQDRETKIQVYLQLWLLQKPKNLAFLTER